MRSKMSTFSKEQSITLIILKISQLEARFSAQNWFSRQGIPSVRPGRSIFILQPFYVASDRISLTTGGSFSWCKKTRVVLIS